MKRRTAGQSTDSPVLTALKRAAQSAREQAQHLGTPCYVWQDGRIIDIVAAPRKPASKPRKSGRSNGAKRA